MRKIFILLVFVYALSGTGLAQIDTLDIGERVPNYYYWDTNWWDYYFLNYSSANPWHYLVYTGVDSLGEPTFDTVFFPEINFSSGYDGRFKGCKLETARYCYTDMALTVIGVAGMFFIWPDVPSDSLKYPEYFRLYEVDNKFGDSMIFMAQARWDTTPIRHYMVSEYYRRNQTNILKTPYPIYEAYFDEPVVVNDSFYVSCTGENLFTAYDTVYSQRVLDDTVINVMQIKEKKNSPDANIVHIGARFDTGFVHPKPPIIKQKVHWLDGHNENDIIVHDELLPDTTIWQYTYKFRNLFFAIFPIFDTCPNCPPVAPDTCKAPKNLRAVISQYEQGSVSLMWDYNGNAELWEVLLCKDGNPAENADITQHTTTFAQFNGLDTAQWYLARVRTKCDSIQTSQWSDSLSFYMPGSGGDPTMIETVADRYTYLMPNPAGETVTVASSFRIGEVELYDLNGKLLARQKVDGLQTALDISALAAGTYIVRVTTNNGTAYKKLVKN